MNQQLRGRRRRRTTVLAAGVTLCVAGGGTVAAGFAASLGGLSSQAVGTWTTVLSADTPTLAGCDNFEGAGGSLSGRAVSDATSCGSLTWSVHVGTWSVASGLASSNGTAGGNATLAAGLSNATATATVAGANTSSRRGGVVVDHGLVNTYLAAVIVGDATNHVDLLLVTLGIPATLATVDVAVSSPTVLSLTRDGSAVTVRLDGVSVLTHTLSVLSIATLSTGSGAGLYASSASVQFDDFRVTTPSPV